MARSTLTRSADNSYEMLCWISKTDLHTHFSLDFQKLIPRRTSFCLALSDLTSVIREERMARPPRSRERPEYLWLEMDGP